MGERGGSEGEGESAEVSLKCLLREHRVCQEGCRGAGREQGEIPAEGEGGGRALAGPRVAGQVWCWGREWGVGGQELEAGRSEKVDKEGPGPGGEGAKPEGLDFLL